ncbi:hypothetical protein P9112_009266 [Eukaryota sp. TZLM1-RC]
MPPTSKKSKARKSSPHKCVLQGTIDSLLPGEKMKVAKLVQQVVQLTRDNEKLSKDLESKTSLIQDLQNNHSQLTSRHKSLSQRHEDVLALLSIKNAEEEEHCDSVTLSTQTREDSPIVWDNWTQVDVDTTSVGVETDFNLESQRNASTTAIDLVLVHRYSNQTQTLIEQSTPLVTSSCCTDNIYTIDREVESINQSNLIEQSTQTSSSSPVKEEPPQFESPLALSSPSSLQLSPSQSSSFGISLLTDGDVDSLLDLISSIDEG